MLDVNCTAILLITIVAVCWLMLQANLPLLQQELTSTNGRVSPPSPRDADRRSLGRPSTAHHEDSAVTPAASLADHRQRLWYLSGLVPGVLLPRHDAGLDLNANGKRTFDRCAVT